MPPFCSAGFSNGAGADGVAWCHQDRFQVIGDGFVGATELAGGTATIVEGFRRVQILKGCQYVQRFIVAAVLGERIGIIGAVLIGNQAPLLLDEFFRLGIPDLPFAGHVTNVLRPTITLKIASIWPWIFEPS